MWSVRDPHESNASAGILELGDFSIRALGAEDFGLVRALQPSTPADIFELPESDHAFRAFIADLGAKPWSLPFVCLRAAVPIGVCFMSVAQLKNLNAYLVAVFSDPADAAVPLALYIRHAFWSFPLHRLYAHVPALAAAIAHAEALARVGFKHEGVLAAHVPSPDGPQDAIVLGLLREEFNVWCAQNQPALAL